MFVYFSLFPEGSQQDTGFGSFKLEEEPAALPKVRNALYAHTDAHTTCAQPMQSIRNKGCPQHIL